MNKNISNSVKLISSYVISFLMPIFILMVCFKLNSVFPFGDSMIYSTDLDGQYSAYLSYFQSVLRGENDFFYTFSKNAFW